MVGMSAYYRDPVLERRLRRRAKPKKRSRGIATILLLVLVAAYVFTALSSELPAGEVRIHDQALLQQVSHELAWPARGQAALGTLDDGVLVRSHPDEQQRPIASLAKVITALAVLEKAPMQPGGSGITFTLDAQDEASYHEYLAKDGAVTAVTAGENMSQYHALQAMLLPSSNNMSDSLVRRVFGSVDAYVTYANDMVKRYGLEQTHVDDASGFSPHTTSTVSEMIAIGQKALTNPVIAEIVAQEHAEIPLSGVVPNYSLILENRSVSGIKIGNTDEAGWCLLFSAKHTDDTGQAVTLIGVVLGEDNPEALKTSSENLLTSAQAELRQVEIVRGGDTIGTYATPWGAEAGLVARESLWSYGWQGGVEQVVFEDHDTSLPLTEKQIVGSLQIGQSGDKRVQVMSDAGIQQPSLLWRLRNGLSFADIF